MNLAARIFAALEAKGERTSLRPLDAAGDTTASFKAAALLDQSTRWCDAYRRAGVGGGDVVAVAPARDEKLVAMHLGAMAAGAAIAPLSSASTPSETSRVLQASGAKLVATSAAFAQANERAAAAVGIPWWLNETDADDAGVPAPFEAAPLPTANVAPSCADLDDDAPALLLFTSGTTGAPKSVPLSHGNLSANLDALAALWNRTGSDRILHMLPAHHFHGLVLALYGALLAGEEIFLMPRFDARASLDAVQRHDVTLLMGVPTMYARMIEAAQPRDSLAGLRLAISGSAPLPRPLFERFRERFGVSLVERYGLSETGIVASNPPERPRGGSVGVALPGTKVAVCVGREYAAPAAGRTGERGEICVAGPSVMAGYGHDDEAKAAAFRDGWFHTGDLGYFDVDGYLWIDGRTKELIIVGGSNVVPGEVERALEEVAGLVEVAAGGIPDEDLGEVVCAYVVAETRSDPAAHAALEQRLRQAADAALAPYKRPRRYVFLDRLPRNAMGKLDRARLLSGAP